MLLGFTAAFLDFDQGHALFTGISLGFHRLFKPEAYLVYSEDSGPLNCAKSGTRVVGGFNSLETQATRCFGRSLGRFDGMPNLLDVGTKDAHVHEILLGAIIFPDTH